MSDRTPKPSGAAERVVASPTSRGRRSLALVTFSYIPGSATTVAVAGMASHEGPASGASVSATPAPSSTFGALTLGISDTPGAICAYDESGCSAGTGISRVTLSADADSSGHLAWPNVQVAFVIETTLYDGVYDPTPDDPGSDPCAAITGTTACEESNGVPFFVAHAQDIANAISEANPHSHVSFAMVDYFATKDKFDDGDGSEYHVDIQQFVPSQDFGSAVTSTFQAEVLGGGYVYPDSDFSDNILHSSLDHGPLRDDHRERPHVVGGDPPRHRLDGVDRAPGPELHRELLRQRL